MIRYRGVIRVIGIKWFTTYITLLKQVNKIIGEPELIVWKTENVMTMRTASCDAELP